MLAEPNIDLRFGGGNLQNGARTCKYAVPARKQKGLRVAIYDVPEAFLPVALSGFEPETS